MSGPHFYREFPAGKALESCVVCFWAGESPQSPLPVEHRILPDGCNDIVFDFSAGGCVSASLVGIMSRPFVFTTTSPTRHLGVRFKPGGITRFLHLDANELADGQADLSFFLGAQSAELWHRLASMNLEKQVPFLRQWLTDQVSGTPGPNPYVSHCIARLQESCGLISLRELEKSTGVSSRQLERLFLKHVGLPPKHFSRLLRFLRASEALDRNSHGSLADIALRLGYADQSHLTRDFREFSGTTPGLLRPSAMA